MTATMGSRQKNRHHEILILMMIWGEKSLFLLIPFHIRGV